jgi:hypothetical protein
MRSLMRLVPALILVVAPALVTGCSGSKSTAPVMTAVNTNNMGKAPQPPPPPPPPK